MNELHFLILLDFVIPIVINTVFDYFIKKQNEDFKKEMKKILND